MIVLFGYIARMARAGTVEALGSDYVRTAVLKGLPRRTVIRRHVLRNSLLPTITVIASQTGYLIGGLFVVETLFHYNGVGTLLLQAATQKDYPMLEAGILTIGVVYMLATLVADLSVLVLESANPLPGSRMSIDVIPVESAGAVAAERTGASPRGELLREIVRSKTFIVGAIIVGFWIICAIFGYAIAPHDPTAENLDRDQQGALRARNLFGTDQLGRDMFSRVITGVRNILIIVPLAVILSTLFGTALGLIMGYFRGLVDESIARVLEAFLALPLVVIALTAITAIGPSNLVVILVIASCSHR